MMKNVACVRACGVKADSGSLQHSGSSGCGYILKQWDAIGLQAVLFARGIENGAEYVVVRVLRPVQPTTLQRFNPWDDLDALIAAVPGTMMKLGFSNAYCLM